ncbi:MAG: type II toxin-antitoxin system HicB family antitoxin [Gammaproteobacteria bacterium]
MSKSPKNQPFPSEINLRALIYHEEGKIVALALEMDLVGHGDTIDEAIADLRDLIRMQIELAISRNNPDLIFKDAEAKYFELFEQLHRRSLRAQIFGSDEEEESEYQSCGVQVLTSDLIAKMKSSTAQAHG